MAENLHNLNELLAELEEKAIHTTQGSFLKVEDVRRLIESKQESEGDEGKEDEPKTMLQARRQASEHLKKQGFGPGQPLEPGKVVSAQEPQPSSRT